MKIVPTFFAAADF